LKLNVLKAVGSAVISQLLNLLNKREFKWGDFIKDVIWNLIMFIAFEKIQNKLTPKKGKEFNKKIRALYGVKGQRSYDRIWNEIVKKLSRKMFFVSSIVDTIRSALASILSIIEKFLIDCLSEAVDNLSKKNLQWI